MIPQPRTFYIRKDHAQVLDYVDAIRAQGGNINILVRGPQGSGKSEMVANYAATRQLDLTVFEIGLLAEPSALFGRVEIVGGDTVYIPGILTKAVQTPNSVIHLQEINRPESDTTLNAIFSLLDPQQREIYLDEADMAIKVAPGVVFFASLNEGVNFVGTTQMDAALQDRFTVGITLEYLPPEAEKLLISQRTNLSENKITQLMTVIISLRKNAQADISISTRSVLGMAKMMVADIPLGVALITCATIPPEKLQDMLEASHFSGVDVETGDRKYTMMMPKTVTVQNPIRI